jgi:atypical protein kinase C iota type
MLFLQNRKILVTYIDPEIMVNGLREEMRAICQFSQDMEQFTMKWIDEEGNFYFSRCRILFVNQFFLVGDPCTISSQVELDEAIRLYEVNKDSEITIHGMYSPIRKYNAHSYFTFCIVFPNVPAAPGLPCQGEDRSIYRRGARRWRKLYRVNGHLFQAKRFNRVRIIG